MASNDLIARLSEIYRENHNIHQRATLKEAMRLVDDTDEKQLSALQLEDKYTPADKWGEHPDFERSEWRSEVVDDLTQSGYWEWVFNQVQNSEDEPS